MKIAYIAGPYRADNYHGVMQNIAHARRVAEKYWRLGYAVICPHLNSAYMDGVVDDAVFLAADITMMKRCNLVVAMVTWSKSEGATKEINLAEDIEMEIVYDDTP